MPKKTEKPEVVAELEEAITEQIKAPRLNIEFGREDLNEMRDAINELYQR